METKEQKAPETFRLKNAPIIEAVLDIDCDMPAGFSLMALETKARESFRAEYPQFKVRLLEKHQIEQTIDQPPKHSTKRGLQALQFLHEDGKQLVQIRAGGFSFNRLEPYASLDEYLPEIERTWRLFLALASPVKIQAVHLRYINRILLPAESGVELGDYLTICDDLPVDSELNFIGFLNQRTALERATGHFINTVIATQPIGNEHLPVIFDITVRANGPSDPENWTWILEKLRLLRRLKNRVFENTLTKKCLSLFQ